MLVFVHSRKETAKTARFLKEEALRNDTLARFLQVGTSTISLSFAHGLPVITNTLLEATLC